MYYPVPITQTCFPELWPVSQTHRAEDVSIHEECGLLAEVNQGQARLCLFKSFRQRMCTQNREKPDWKVPPKSQADWGGGGEGEMGHVPPSK